MDIGIVSFTSTKDNYGQVLQCFALQHYLRCRGHNAFHIRYVPTKKADTGSARLKCAKAISKLSDPRYTYDKARHVIKGNPKSPDRCFSDFISTSLATSARVYRSYDELKSDPPQADAYIAGSDQIWGLSLDDPNSRGWFLRFGSPDSRRLSYAASAGRELDGDEVRKIASLVSDYRSVGVRECALAEQLVSVGVPAQTVVDPTLLLDGPHYLDALHVPTNRETEGEYVFAYILNAVCPRDVYWPALKDYLLATQRNLMPVYSSGYYSAYPLIPGYEPSYPTIEEWLGLLAGASRVVTTSFHGVVFSILLHRPFAAIPLVGSHKAANARLVTLLESLDLDDRICSSGSSLARILDTPIDWGHVDARIQTSRELSENFLVKALSC